MVTYDISLQPFFWVGCLQDLSLLHSLLFSLKIKELVIFQVELKLKLNELKNCERALSACAHSQST